MRLADQIIAAAGSRNDQILGGSISAIANDLATAQLFDLSNEVRDACGHVACSRPSSIISAIPVTRLPYPKTWVEWQPGGPGVSDTANDSRPRPSRIGCLLVAADHKLQIGTMTWAWAHSNTKNPIVVNPLGMVFDWRADANLAKTMSNAATAVRNMPPEVRAKLASCGLHPDADAIEHLANNWSTCSINEAAEALRRTERWGRFHSNKQELAAAIQLSRHDIMVPSLYCMNFWRDINNLGKDSQNQLINSWFKDLSGEPPFALAFVIMLNAKGATTQSREDLSKLNRARKKKGAAVLKEYIITQLCLSKTAANRGAALGLDRAAARRHLVRGHFKVRRSGIFWWAPFVRGNADKVARYHYAVRT